ncbi:MAG: sugar transferase [Candidatus Paceibacterota bacterium]|jgi:lipopolysaccharide/colanic/teichoic acid biosynthesis glycosyltransferase
MKLQSKKETIILLLGDLALFNLALWLALFLRTLAWPEEGVFYRHLQPFSVIFLIWILVFYIAGLYGKQTVIFQRRLPRLIFNSLLVNSTIAVVFFYFIPYFGITPKTILFLDLILSFILIFGWRRFFAPNISLTQREKILFTCRGAEVTEIVEEIKNNPRYNIEIADYDDIKKIGSSGVTAVVVDLYDENIHEALKNFYKMIFSGIRFISVHNLYEELFDRELVNVIKEQWFLENISNRPKPVYDALKRLMDATFALVAGLISLLVYPFVYVAIKLDDGGVIFSLQERVGKDGKLVTLIKFRTMKIAYDGAKWGEGRNEVTKVGKFLRKTRIDELPQLWNVLIGDLSLVGPRPEFADPVALYSQDIPYFNIRHIIKPGLSGWAQIHQDGEPHHGISVNETKVKFAYDLYYIKNRSFWLDVSIALKTIKTLIMRKGI